MFVVSLKNYDLLNLSDMKTKLMIILLMIPAITFSQNLFLKFINDPFENWMGGYNDKNEMVLISNDGFYTTFLKLNENLDTLYTMRYNAFENITNSFIIPDTANNMYLVKIDTSNIYLSLNKDFSYQWAKSFAYDTNLMHPFLSEFVFGKRLLDGNILLVSKNIIPTHEGFAYDIAPIILLTDNNGNLLWSKKYHIPTKCFEPMFIVEKESVYILFGTMYALEPGMPSTTNSLAGFAINKTDGEVIGEVNVYSIDGDLEIKNVSEDGNFLSGIYFNPFEDTFGYAFISDISETGELNNFKMIYSDTHPSIYLTTISNLNNGKIAFGGTARTINEFGGTNEGQFFTFLTDNLLEQADWASVYSDTTTEGDFLNTGCAFLSKETDDNNLLFWGNYSNSNGMNYAFKVDSNTGNSACKNNPINVSFTSFEYNFQNFEVTEYSNIFADGESYDIIDDIPESPTGSINISTICESSTGINDIDKTNELLVFPNPVKDMLNISSNLNLIGKSYTLYNSEGKICNTGIINNNFSININSQTSGIYYLKISTFTPQKVIIIKN
jgi:hypothetical protein